MKDTKLIILATLILVFVFIFNLNSIKADAKYKDAVLKKQIAQMILVGFNGQVLDSANPIYSQIKNLGIGGVILFSKNADVTQPKLVKNIDNPKQVKKLISDLQKISDTPLFVAVDQEGGRVSRLDPKVFEVSAFSAKELGGENDEKLTYNEALKTVKTLSGLGFNINFAPVVDLEINKNSQIISKLKRAYSEDPDIVVAHARQVILAHDKYGVLPVIKHFPGHGSVEGDTHLGFVDATSVYSKNELLPYAFLIADPTATGVLVAHVFNSYLDPEFPASMSKKTVQDLLKTKLGFLGLVFTDDIQMKAIEDNYTLEEALLNVINAGGDVIVIGNNLSYKPNVATEAVDIIFNLVKSGKVSQERIEESYEKIMRQKEKMKGKF
ncbi:beta-N-acetylhexosaminidase [Candidatus Gastranaerophilus sp. (ex Termes propinquus)]|nr:beta-N-acetylhexosaminidase [Candidatus Gastranaerophilus sp. (ex Termes propinquus)]